MGLTEAERDEPLTPAGRLFLQPEMNQVIHCIIGAERPIDVAAVKAEIAASAMMKHPRFSSLLVTANNGREHWRKTSIDIDRHVIVREEPVGTGAAEDAVNDYVADLAVSSPLPVDKPLWEVHLLLAHDCAVMRVHHALGDGISLMSMFLTACRRADDPNRAVTIGSVGAPSANRTNSRGMRLREIVWRFMKVVWLTIVYFVGFCSTALCLADHRTALSGGDGVELWPRKLVTAKFRLDDMKTVKNAVADATINDVLFGVISSGLSKYLDIRTPKSLPEGLQITGVAMVNLRKQPGLKDLEKLMGGNSGSRWGNKFGMILLPVYYHEVECPLDHVKRAKAMIDRKKLSLEAYLSYQIADFVMSLSGAKGASWLNYRILCNTTFTISNVVGPQEEITIASNLVKFLRVTNSALPHAITMHMVSYAGRAEMQIMVAKDIIPDPKMLAKCFEDALLEMKETAEAVM